MSPNTEGDQYYLTFTVSPPVWHDGPGILELDGSQPVSQQEYELRISVSREQYLAWEAVEPYTSGDEDGQSSDVDEISNNELFLTNSHETDVEISTPEHRGAGPQDQEAATQALSRAVDRARERLNGCETNMRAARQQVADELS